MSDQPAGTALDREALLALLSDYYKTHSMNGLCGLCGERSHRDFVGFRWLFVDETIASDPMKVPDGFIPCAILNCAVCGLVSHVNLFAIGILSRQVPPAKPTLTLIKGGAEDAKDPMP